jgi:hypothetical protein
LNEALFQVTPDFMSAAMRIALNSLSETAVTIRDKILVDVSGQFIQSLAYMDELQPILCPSSGAIRLPGKLVRAFTQFTKWASGEGRDLVDAGFLEAFLPRVLEVFFAKSQEAMERVTQVAISVSQIAHTTVDVDAVRSSLRSKLKLDLEYITCLGKDRVDVTILPIQRQLKEFLD